MWAGLYGERTLPPEPVHLALGLMFSSSNQKLQAASAPNPQCLNPSNDGAQFCQLSVYIGVAAIEVIDPVDSGIAIRAKRGDD